MAKTWMKNMFIRVGIVCSVISFCFSSVYAINQQENSICVERINDVLLITGEGNGKYLSERLNISGIVNHLHQGSEIQNSFCFMLYQTQPHPSTEKPEVTPRPGRVQPPAHPQNTGPNSGEYRIPPNHNVNRPDYNPYTTEPMVTDRPRQNPTYSQIRGEFGPNSDNYDGRYTTEQMVVDRPYPKRIPAYPQSTESNRDIQTYPPYQPTRNTTPRPRSGTNPTQRKPTQSSTPLPEILNLDPSLPAYFADNYQPISKPLRNNIQLESNSTLFRPEFERLVKGITNNNLFVSSQSSVDPYQYLYPSETLCSFARLVCNKKEVQIDPSKLKPSPTLVGNIRNIVRNKNSTSLQRAKKLVQTLNKYSWYVPIHYILGSAFYETQCAPLNGYTDFEESKNTLKTHLEALYVDYIHSYDRENAVQNSNVAAPNNMDLWSVGANGAKDIASFFNNIGNEENWQIIRYIEFYPTLLLLKDEYNWEFSECAKLLRDHYFKNEIKQLQYQIDIYKYAQTVVAALSPKGF